MYAIETKYLGPTNSRGSRVQAKNADGKVTLSWDHAKSSDDNHRAAALHLARAQRVAGNWYGGERADGQGHVYVCASSDLRHDFRTLRDPDGSVR